MVHSDPQLDCQRIRSVFAHGVRQSEDVFRRDVGLGVVHGARDVPARRTQVVNALPDFGFHICNQAVRQDMLRIDSTPERHPLFKTHFESGGVTQSGKRRPRKQTISYLWSLLILIQS